MKGRKVIRGLRFVRFFGLLGMGQLGEELLIFLVELPEVLPPPFIVQSDVGDDIDVVPRRIWDFRNRKPQDSPEELDEWREATVGPKHRGN